MYIIAHATPKGVADLFIRKNEIQNKIQKMYELMKHRRQDLAIRRDEETVAYALAAKTLIQLASEFKIKIKE